MKFYQTKKFMELQKRWGEKLKKSGFKDLEGNGETMPHGTIKRPERISAIVEYHTQASKFYWDYKFKTEREKIIWFHHSEGVPYREIAKLVHGENLKSVYVVVNNIRVIFLEYVKAQWDYENDNENE
jgi:2'-5' RNA ligase